MSDPVKFTVLKSKPCGMQGFDWLRLGACWQRRAAHERSQLPAEVIEQLNAVPRIAKQGLVRTLLAKAKQQLSQAGVSNKELARRMSVTGAAVSQWFNPPIASASRTNLIDAANLALLIGQPECQAEIAAVLVHPWVLPVGQLRHCLQWVRGLLHPAEVNAIAHRVDFEVLFHSHQVNSEQPSVPLVLFELFPDLTQADVESIMAHWGAAYRAMVTEIHPFAVGAEPPGVDHE